MANVPIRIVPGMDLNTTEYDAKQRWIGGNWVRFWRGKVRPIGGWQSASTAEGPVVLDGVARAMHYWRDQAELKHLAIGTNTSLYDFDGSNLKDISPVTDPVPPGLLSGGAGSGYGGFTYGTENYGEERSFASLTIAPASWTIDNWGEQGVACANWYGVIYKWAPADLEATAIEDVATGVIVPQQNRAILVTNERHLVAIGAGVYTGSVWERDQRRIAWSSQEDYADWVPSITNSAGDLQLQTAGVAVCGAKFRTEVLLWTDVDVHRMSYLGPPYFYGITRLADNAGIVSPMAFAATNRFVLWVSPDAVMLYDGSVKELAPEISEWYRRTANPAQVGKLMVGHNPKFNEIYIFFASTDSDEVDTYAIWNYEENTWCQGAMQRTIWNAAAIFNYPMATKPGGTEANPTSALLQHELGYTDAGVSRNGKVWIESSPIEIAAGDNLVVARKFIQDSFSKSSPPSAALRISFKHRLAPEGEEIVEGPYTIDAERGYTDVRFTGRQVQLYFEQIADEDWSIGDWRLEIVPGSGR